MRLTRQPERNFGTVRLRLTVVASAAVALVLAVSGVCLVVAQEHLMIASVDESLVQRADNVQADVARGVYGSVLPTEGDREDTFLQLLDGRGNVSAASANATAIPAISGPANHRLGDVLTNASDLPISRHEFRVLVRNLPRSSATLIVGKNLDDVEEGTSILRTLLLVAVPAVILVLALVVWLLTGRVLRPVEAIRSEVANIQGNELHRRVAVGGSSDEISCLAITMNAMLERLERATDRERQFVADSSHELRGPLTRLRSELEVSMSHPDTTNQESLRLALITEVVQLQQLVEDLLFLARSESDAMGQVATVLDLDDIVLDEVRSLRERAAVSVDASAVSAARIRGNEGQLARAIRNLASNAERHATSTVWFELREHDGTSELVIADDGPGIPIEHRTAVFQRFIRLDPARSEEAGGSGLGLAIVHDIVARHAGTVVVTGRAGQGARLVVTLPSYGDACPPRV